MTESAASHSRMGLAPVVLGSVDVDGGGLEGAGDPVGLGAGVGAGAVVAASTTLAEKVVLLKGGTSQRQP